jgi:hypothetical protein
VWPDIHVNEDTGKQLREGILQRLFEKYGQRELTFNDWHVVVDHRMYETTGLRMIGSRKAKQCMSCGNKSDRRASCQKCDGTGTVDMGKVYSPKYTLSSEWVIHEIADDVKVWSTYAERLSLRKPDCTDSIILKSPQWFDRTKIPPVYVEPPKRGPQKRKRSTAGFSETVSKIYVKDIVPSDPRFDAVAKLVASKYQDRPEVVSIVTTENENSIAAHTRSKYCRNKGSEHNGSHVWFHITPNGIAQKCFSRKPVEHSRGKCSKYASERLSLNDDEIRCIFGMKKVSAAVKRRRLHEHNDRNADAFKAKMSIKKSANFLAAPTKQEASKKLNDFMDAWSKL